MLELRKLPSGIDIIMDPVDEVESVAIGIWVKTGAINEEEKYAGISHFVEHMMFKGTETRSPKDIAADIDKIGGQINAFTGKEATCYHVKVLTSSYKKAADVLVDMITNSTFKKEEMDKERQVICEEIKMTLDSPEDLVHDISTELIFKKEDLGKSIIGTPTSLKRITSNVIKSYVGKRYTRDNLVISVAGKFDKDDICEYFMDKFTNLEEKTANIDYMEEDYQPSFKVVKKDIEQTHLCMGMPSYSMEQEEYYSLLVLNNILGGTMSSRLFQNIREEKGLAYSVFSMTAAFKEKGYFKIYAGVANDKISSTIDGIKEELVKIKNQGITEEELDSSREQLKAAFIFGQENTAARMFTNGRTAILLNKLYSMEDVIELYDKVNMERIQDIKNSICDFYKFSGAAVTGSKSLSIKNLMEA